MKVGQKMVRDDDLRAEEGVRCLSNVRFGWLIYFFSNKKGVGLK